MTKKEIRRHALASRRGLTHEERVAKSRQIISKLTNCAEYTNADTVFCYVSVEDEVHTDELLQKIIKAGKRLCVPRITDIEGGIMVAAELKQTEDLTEGAFGIFTAPDGAEEIQPENIDLVIVPGAAFDEQGHRIGMGGGYYDRFLGKVAGKSVGIAYECQLYENLPVEAHDKKVDNLITERKDIH